jgi:thiamine pyrophosphokinase
LKAAIILKNAYLNNFNKNDYDIVIGADRGAYFAISNNINPDISIGDFDSVNDSEFELIKKNSKKIIKLNPIKDESDTHEAIELVKDYEKIIIFGGIKGKRIEHLFANIIDLINYPNLSMIDEDSLIETVNDNNYKVKDNYKFVSLYAIEESIIDLNGFKYELNNYLLKRNDPLCLSNEIINNPKINLKKGKLLIIYSHGD